MAENVISHHFSIISKILSDRNWVKLRNFGKFGFSFSHTTENYKEFALQISYYSFPRQDLNPEAE
jgi:hypothetical protein